MSLSTVLVIASLAFAEVGRADGLDDYMRAGITNLRIPGIVFGVFKDGKILHSGAYGLANVELKVPATVDNVFEIGSVTKQFTATVILILMQEGKLELSDRIDKYLGGLPESWRAVTIRQLLNHTSGIPDIEEIIGYDAYRNIYTYDQIVAVANSKPMDFLPGTKWHYSNTGYFLLGHILQKIEGEPYDELLRQRILNPLGMSDTRQSDPGEMIPGRCAGYQWRHGRLCNSDAMQPTAAGGAGSLVSNIKDMAKWDSAITHNRFLKPEIQKLMWERTPTADGVSNYGFGWFVDEWRGHASVEHAGGTAGFSCDYRRFQNLGLSYVVFCNLYAGSMGEFGLRAVDSVHPGLSYVSVKPIKDDPEIHQFLLKAMADVAKGGSGSPYVTDAQWKEYPNHIRQVWGWRLSNLKSFELLEHTRYAPVDSEAGERVVETCVYRMKAGEKILYILFKLTADRQVAWQRRVESYVPRPELQW